jgi:hypothetical protein
MSPAMTDAGSAATFSTTNGVTLGSDSAFTASNVYIGHSTWSIEIYYKAPSTVGSVMTLFWARTGTDATTLY